MTTLWFRIQLMNIRQVFCRHHYHEITTKPNLKAGVRHGQCECGKIVTFWRIV